MNVQNTGIKIQNKAKRFEDLIVWKKAHKLTLKIYKITRDYPSEEKFGLVNQMRCAAVSVPANVAEGFKRYHNKEYRQFLYVTLGSCAELETQITIAKELKYIREDKESVLLERLDHIGRMITSLLKKL